MLFRVSVSLWSGWIPMRVTRKVRPMKIVAKIVPMSTRVITAFRVSGLRKLGTPFAIASLPVKPTEPDANARSTRRIPRGAVPAGSNGSGGVTAAGRSPGEAPHRPDAGSAHHAGTHAEGGGREKPHCSPTPRRLAG